MIIDSLMKAFEDQAFVAGVTEGTIDLYGEDIAVYPDSNLRKKNGRGTGSPLLVHGVISPGGTGATTASGTAVLTLKMGDTNPATVVVQISNYDGAYWAENAGMHFTAIVPYTVEGRFLSIEIDSTAVTGLGTEPTATAFVSPQ